MIPEVVNTCCQKIVLNISLTTVIMKRLGIKLNLWIAAHIGMDGSEMDDKYINGATSKREMVVRYKPRLYRSSIIT